MTLDGVEESGNIWTGLIYNNNLLGELEVGLGREGGARQADNVTCAVVTSLNGLSQGDTLNQTSQKATNKGITGTVGVDDLVGGHGRNGELVDLTTLENKGGVGSLSEDDDALLLSVLGEGGNLGSGSLEVSLIPTRLLGKSSSLVLVADNVVSIRENGLHLVPEELNEERSRDVHDEGLVVLIGVLTNADQGLGLNSQEETSGVEDFSLVEDTLHVLAVEVRQVEVVGSTEESNQRALLVLNENGAATSGGSISNVVVSRHTITLSDFLQLGGSLVLTDGASVVSNTRLLQHPGSSADRVLTGTSSDEFGIGAQGNLVIANRRQTKGKVAEIIMQMRI
jgi:hypothetical protein